jgi:hypothetical protein
MVITVRTNTPLRYEQVTDLQKTIATRLQKSVALKVIQVLAEQFDPLIPPTFTPTLTLTLTSTPGSSLTPTFIPTATATFTVTPSSTPTPAMVQVDATGIPPLKLYQVPGGPVIGQIRAGQVLTRLYGRLEFDGLIWVEVMDDDGRIGWIPEACLHLVTATPLP